MKTQLTKSEYDVLLAAANATTGKGWDLRIVDDIPVPTSVEDRPTLLTILNILCLRGLLQTMLAPGQVGKISYQMTVAGWYTASWATRPE